ncbi:MAG: PIN domain-containing protein [Gemmatimonadota bacterium]
MVLADTGALYALMDRSDAWHERTRRWWGEHGASVIVPSVVLPEVCYLLQARIGAAAEHDFIRAVADGEFVLEDPEPDDIARAADIMRQYADFPLGFVDSAIVAMSERLWTRDVLTTDRRHFGAVRPKHARTLTLLP